MILRGEHGKPLICLISARIISLNNVDHVISTICEISKIKKIEEEYATQKVLFEAMFDAIDEGIVITNTSREILMANKGMENTFGYAPEDLLGQTSSVLYSDMNKYRSADLTSQTQYSTPNGRRYVAAYRHKTGVEFPGETLGVKLFDHHNNWVGNLGIIRDISERQEQDEKLERLAAAIEQTNDTIVITDALGQIGYVNPAFEKISGFKREEALGQNPRKGC